MTDPRQAWGDLLTLGHEIADAADLAADVHDPNAEMLRDWHHRIASIVNRLERFIPKAPPG